MNEAIAFVCLAAWFVIVTLVVRHAERHVTHRALPAPWASATCALALGTLALALHPLPEAVLRATACLALVAASATDQRTGYLFDAITLPTALVVGTLAIGCGATAEAVGGVTLLVGSFGAIVVLSRGSLMGLGDVKAMYAIGAAFGPLESIVAIFAACVSGTLTTVVTARFARGTEVRFGPHLAVGCAIALVVGDPLARRLLGA